jgi:hypothetical protein
VITCVDCGTEHTGTPLDAAAHKRNHDEYMHGLRCGRLDGARLLYEGRSYCVEVVDRHASPERLERAKRMDLLASSDLREGCLYERWVFSADRQQVAFLVHIAGRIVGNLTVLRSKFVREASWEEFDAGDFSASGRAPESRWACFSAWVAKSHRGPDVVELLVRVAARHLGLDPREMAFDRGFLVRDRPSASERKAILLRDNIAAARRVSPDGVRITWG